MIGYMYGIFVNESNNSFTKLCIFNLKMSI